jgi:hypothetical protein
MSPLNRQAEPARMYEHHPQYSISVRVLVLYDPPTTGGLVITSTGPTFDERAY